MATAAKLETEVLPPANDIVLAVEASPQIVLLEPEKFDQFYERVKAEADKLVPDTSSKKGRDAIRSMASKIAATKAAIEKSRLTLTKAWRDQTDAVNDAGKSIKQRLGDLQDTVRQPLTEWEEAEKARVEECEAIITNLALAGVVTIEDTTQSVRDRGKRVWETVIDRERFGDLADQAQSAKDHAVEVLKAALVRLTREEEERAELEKLRAEKEERDAREAEERAKQEAIEGRRKYARDVIEHIHQCGLGMIGGKTYPYIILIRELEEKVVVSEADFGDMAGDVEKARVETLARVKEAQAAQAERAQREAAEAAAEVARRAAIAEAEEAAAEKDRLHADALAEEKRLREQAEADALAERQRIANEAAAEKAQREAEIAEQTRREKNRAHRAQIIGEAKIAIMAAGSIEATAAEAIVRAIAKEVIPHVTLRF